MDFAKKQLEKYGWKEGQGLGKNERGISTPIKPKLKFDNSGIGHNEGDEFKDNWWDNIYNQAASNIHVSQNSDDVRVTLVSEESIDISTKGHIKNLKKQNKNLEYGSFIKRSTLTEGGTINETDSVILEENLKTNSRILTDSELLAACEGRTAHKGARHGLKQSGKLSRLEKQEKMLLKKLKKVSLTDNVDINKKSLEKKLRQLNSHKDKNKEEDSSPMTSKESLNSEKNFLLVSPSKLNKNGKKQRKRVSFHETVTEYQTQELDLSTQSVSSENDNVTYSTVTMKSKLQGEINEAIEKNVIEQDEGIDCSEMDTKNSDSNSNSDELDISVYNELSKKERKILKRNLNKQNMNSSWSEKRDMDKTNDVNFDKEILEINGKCQKCSKRKLKFEPDDVNESDNKKSHYENKRLNKFKNKDMKKKKKLEKRLNKIVDSLHSCKISE